MAKAGVNYNTQRRNPGRNNSYGNSRNGYASAGRNAGKSRNSGKVRDFNAYRRAHSGSAANTYGNVYGGEGVLPRQGYGNAAYQNHLKGRQASSTNRQTARIAASAQTQTLDAGRDYSLIFIVLFFLAFGLVMLYSTSSYEAGIDFNDPGHYLKRQLVSVIVGLGLMVFVAVLPLKAVKKLSPVLYGVATLLVLMIIPFGRSANGAKRWLYFGSFSIQPAEISKLAVIVVTALWLSKCSRDFLKSWKKSIIALLPAIIQAVMIYGITRNMSSAVIVLAIALCMLFVSTEDYKRYALLLLLVIAGFTLWVYLATHGGDGGTFRSDRIRYWLDPQAYADSGALQTLQGLYGIGSGGIFGKGLGQSMQKLGYIPEAQNDMIFSIICEELGLFGAVSIIAMFIILCWRLMIVALQAKDMFSSLLVVGVMAQIAVQVFLNIAVVTNLIPNTGVTLPFFSYGGSAVVIQLIEIGLVLNVARNSAR